MPPFGLDPRSIMPSLTREDVLRATDIKTFNRGRLYFEQGRVVELDRIDKGDGFQRFQSRVRGGGGKVYAQRVLIAPHARHAVVSGSCDCPVGYACKHVVAACLAYMEEVQPRPVAAEDSPPEAVRGWLQRVAAAGAPALTDRNGERLLYLLQPAPGDAHGVAVELAVVRPLKGSGRMSKGRRLNLGNLLYGYTYAAYLGPEDKQILGMLRGLASGGWVHSLTLTGPVGRIALGRMVDTQRCHWKTSDSPPLASGEERCLAPAWQETPEGALRLVLAPDAQVRVLLTEPPLYLDGQAHTVGSLDALGLTRKQLQELAAGPAMRSRQAEAITRLLALEFPQLPLPTPVPLEVAEVRDTPPVPCLRLAARDGGHVGNAGAVSNLAAESRQGADTHLLLLDFDYAGQRVPGWPTVPPQHHPDPRRGGADPPRRRGRDRCPGPPDHPWLHRPPQPVDPSGLAAPAARREQPHRAGDTLVRPPARRGAGVGRRGLAS